MRVALVELPPFGHGTPVESLVRDRASRERLFIRGRLSADRDWFVQTPVLIETTGGIVSRIPPASFLDEAASSRNANVTAGFLD